MSELLLPAKQAATRLGLSLRSFYRYRNRLIARGMQAVRAGRRIAYREASIDRLIREAAEKDEALYEASSRVVKESSSQVGEGERP